MIPILSPTYRARQARFEAHMKARAEAAAPGPTPAVATVGPPARWVPGRPIPKAAVPVTAPVATPAPRPARRAYVPDDDGPPPDPGRLPVRPWVPMNPIPDPELFVGPPRESFEQYVKRMKASAEAGIRERKAAYAREYLALPSRPNEAQTLQREQ